MTLSPEQLQADQDELTGHISEILSIPEDHASVLLLAFKWDKEKLLDAFYSDPDRTRARAGAIQGELGNMNPQRMRESFVCPVTYESVPYSDTMSMGCEEPGQVEHRFSLDAWEHFLHCRVGEGAVCLFTLCQAQGCSCIVSPRVWRLVLNQSASKHGHDSIEAQAANDALKRYERFLSSNYVDMNRSIRWCPTPNCGWAVRALGPCREVKCEHCRYSFCFRCGENAHAPLSCKGLEEWNEKCSNESETANWFVANTKKCPSCSTHIEKNHGCNHMSCRICKHEFCWICMGNWSDHGASTGGYYACNKFDASVNANKDESVNNAKRELDRYIHYYTRFQGHDQAGKFAAKQRQHAEERMTELQKKGGKGWIDVQFIMEAVEQVIECRRVLKYTYAYAFQLEEGSRKTLFEYNQGMLEANTEKLTELSEMDVEKADRTEVINYTKVTAQFLKALLDEVYREEMEGFNHVPTV